ncbi:hypothetical protein B7494_g3694 [Chlorociboria aeruginascens]|nr:hypothetical protein B7494_g3694 [Chlorociboria aeruginascens]
MTLPDVECAAFLKSMKTPSQDWKVVDKRRNNVLHHAATLFKLTSVRWLVDTIDLDTSLRLARNIDGYTPLEALQAELETTRVRLKKGMMTISKSDTFQGYHLDAVQCLVALQGLQDPTTDQLLHLEFGCTCGQCIQGLMSPRMKYALLAKAEIYHDMLDFEISDGPGWCEWFDYIITHVAPDIQTNFRTNKSHRKGFSNIFLYVAHCLHSDIIPNVQNVMEKLEDEGEWPPVTRGFIQRGGKVESVLQVVFEHSCDEDEKAGDGTFKNDFKEALLNLPSCRNDHEFGFLAKACGFMGVFCDYANYRCV